MSFQTNLSNYNNNNYRSGTLIARLIWYAFNVIFFKSSWIVYSPFKVIILKLFGAKVGKGVLIKPNVNIKYPWRLIIGNHVWIGENVWIDNLDMVNIGDNVCISQGAMLLTGNHNYNKITFDLITQPVILENGVWVGAKSIVCPGVICASHSVLTAGSVASDDLEAFTINKGNPAVVVKSRSIKS